MDRFSLADKSDNVVAVLSKEISEVARTGRKQYALGERRILTDFTCDAYLQGYDGVYTFILGVGMNNLTVTGIDARSVRSIGIIGKESEAYLEVASVIDARYS